MIFGLHKIWDRPCWEFPNPLKKARQWCREKIESRTYFNQSTAFAMSDIYRASEKKSVKSQQTVVK